MYVVAVFAIVFVAGMFFNAVASHVVSELTSLEPTPLRALIGLNIIVAALATVGYVNNLTHNDRWAFPVAALVFLLGSLASFAIVRELDRRDEAHYAQWGRWRVRR